MADKGLYLIDVTIRPCSYMKDVVTGSWNNLREGSKAGNGKLIHGFKVGSPMYFGHTVCCRSCDSYDLI